MKLPVGFLAFQKRSFCYGLLICSLSIFFVMAYEYDVHHWMSHYQDATKRLQLSSKKLLALSSEYESAATHDKVNYQQFLTHLTKNSSHDSLPLLNQAALQTQLTITRIKPNSLQQSTTFTIQTLQIEATGTYHQFFHFLLALSRLPIVIVIQTLDVTPDDHQRLLISMTLAIASL
jgi:Tfp pilus assembly protein PilO